MKIVYQGKDVETSAGTVAEFLAEKGVDAKKAIVEYASEVHAPGADLSGLKLEEGATLDVFRLAAGG
ncbi:MAG: hypothetical protein J5807_03350 [Kiritimatiellae bacterium]|nr:hypothetical protein [Kiritimatiellia bacterium]